MKTFRLGDLKPSQQDDGRYPVSTSPIEIYKDGNKWVIAHGNHRYYRALEEKGPDGRIRVREVPSPYY